MNQVLRKFIPRAPRYVLRPSDAQVLSFSKERERGTKHETRIINVSATGIAFLVSREEAPRIGDHIKIEFPVPGGNNVAWWARVARIESYSDERWWDKNDSFDSPKQVVVGVQYIDLPDGHKRDIQKGLEIRYKELKQQYFKERLSEAKEFAVGNFWNFILFGLCIVAGVMAIMLFTHYEPIFDRKNGSAYFKLFEDWDF